MRSTTIELSFEDMIRIAESIGSWEPLYTAIGYLSTWNLDYPQVSIFSDRGNDLVAVYRDADGERKYVIGAIWYGDRYGFHS